MVVGGSASISETMMISLIKWRLAERTGWTMEYIDNLSLDTLMFYLGIQDADAKYQEYERERAQRRRGRR